MSNPRGALAAFTAGYEAGLHREPMPKQPELSELFEDIGIYRRAYASGKKFISENS